jgi:TP901 family phage tail tape measure protein
MPLMGGGNPISVAANFRLVFDTRSATRTATQYDAAMSNLAAKGAQNTSKANEQLKREHADVVKRVLADNLKAETEFKTRSKEVFRQVSRDANKSYAESQRRIMKVMPRASGEYKKAASEYKLAMLAMSNVNKRYAADMKRLGISARTEGFSVSGFGKESPANRRIAIQHIKDEIRLNKMNKHELRAAKHIRDTMISVDNQRLALERELNMTIKQGRFAIQASNREMHMGMVKNNTQLKIYRQNLMEASMLLNQMSSQIKMGLTQALMTSSIALITFGFKLSQIIQEFKEFEQELRNANSIWQETNETLYKASDTILRFGTVYGIEMQQATEGLYQMASAGLTAAEAQEMLASTLILSMAVQGDHETLAKLTIQVLKGFNKEMSEASIETDKMAYAINKSLLQWEDLASGVKFAMPFFVSMNQETEQLYGALEVLADRALEAGISGRGLRQALAQFAKHADDNTAAFNRMGIATMDNHGNFLQLTEIAKNFSDAFGDSYTDAEAMTQLLEDFNVRGATAFVHLVQNAEEFNDRVLDLANSAGAAKEMADKQNESIQNQINIMKNAWKASLFMSDANYAQLGAMNELDYLTKLLVMDFRDFMFVQTETGLILSENGKMMRDLVLQVLRTFVELARAAYIMLGKLGGEGQSFAMVMWAMTIPLRAIIRLLSIFGEGTLEAVILYKMLNTLIPMNSFYMYANQRAMVTAMGGGQALAASQMQLAGAMAMTNLLMFGGLLLMQKSSKAYQTLGVVLTAVAGAWMGVAIAKAMATDPTVRNMPMLVAAAAVGATVAVGFGLLMKDMMKPPDMADLGYEPIDFSGNYEDLLFDPAMGGAGLPPELTESYMDSGGRFIPTYHGGGRMAEHGLARLQKGETVIPKTQNMLGGAGGITIIIHGDVYDGDNFAEKVQEAMGPALQQERMLSLSQAVMF